MPARHPAILVVGTLLPFLAVAIAVAAPPAGGCIYVWPEARYAALGYNHVVHLQNTYAKSFACDVWTDVDPTKVKLVIAPNAHTEVVTFVGSPVRVFNPYATCHAIDTAPNGGAPRPRPSSRPQCPACR